MFGWCILDPQVADEVNLLKARVAALEEQNSKLIFTNASLMELVNDLRKSKQELEAENIHIKQDNSRDAANGRDTSFFVQTTEICISNFLKIPWKKRHVVPFFEMREKDLQIVV